MKQETFEEVAKLKYGATIYGLERVNAFVEGAKWQQENSYSEEDMKQAVRFGFDKGFCSNSSNKMKNLGLSEQEWFNQFKKK
jgi:hypothetical protein